MFPDNNIIKLKNIKFDIEKLTEAYDPPKSINTLILTYGDERGTGSIYIPRVDHGQSIMADYVTADNDSWVKLKFGHCEYVG